MAIDYALKLRDGKMDEGVRDLLIQACPELSILEPSNEHLKFDLESDLLFVWGCYSEDTLRDLGGHSLATHCLVRFRHKKHDTPAAALQMLRCVLHLMDYLDNDMVLIWQNDHAVLARVGGELMLRQGDDFWSIPERLAMLEGRPYRVAACGCEQSPGPYRHFISLFSIVDVRSLYAFLMAPAMIHAQPAKTAVRLPNLSLF